jgi:hypothetical protein
VLLTGLAVRSSDVAAQSTAISAVWAHDGEDKVTQDELRASSGQTVTNSLWDGSTIMLFGLKNEVIDFNLVLEAASTSATNVTVAMSNLNGPSGSVIRYAPRSTSNLFDWTTTESELFYVRYLQIVGLSYFGYGALQTWQEPTFPQRAQCPSGTGCAWTARPVAGKFYPDIAVPIELAPNFSIAAGNNQAIWADIYIPKTAAAGSYSGSVTVSENGVATHTVPIGLTVRNATLPDAPSSKTMLVTSYGDLSPRYGSATIPALQNQIMVAHRHKLSLIDDNFGQGWGGLQPAPQWLQYLSGTAFTSSNGYAGPGVSTGQDVFSIGTYGAMTVNASETQTTFTAQFNGWESWFEANSPSTERFVYLCDEIGCQSNTPTLTSQLQWWQAIGGVGQNLHTMATQSLSSAVGTVLSYPTSTWPFSSQASSGDQTNANSILAAAPARKLYAYNGARPGGGSMIVEDEGTSMRELPWGQNKKQVDRFFVWESTYYNDYQNGRGNTNVFATADTFGQTSADPMYGQVGGSNGDGVMFYPGTDAVFPAFSYGVDGPIASLRLKYWRRGIQDVDYLTLANAINPAAVATLVNSMVPAALWENQCFDLSDCSYFKGPVSWSNKPDDWESARLQLANIIAPLGGVTATLAANPASIASGQSSTLTWSSINAASCTGTNFSTGNATSGSVSASPAANTTYTVGCTGTGGTASASATVTVNTGLQGYWGLDEGSGTTTADSSGNGNTGTLSGTPLPTWTAGLVGNALSFAGSGGFVNFPNSPSLSNLQSQAGGGMSVVTWIYPTSSNANQTFLDKAAWTFGFYTGLGIQFSHVCTSGRVAVYSPANSVPLNQWSQIVATWNGSTTGSSILMYINGAAVTTNTQDCSGSASDDSANALTLGGTYYNGNPFFGKLDDIGVYNRILSASEVSSLYSTPSANLAANPAVIGSGQSSTLTWSSTNATYCTGTNFSTGNATSGSVPVSPAATTTYTVGCTGTGGTASASATVTVNTGLQGYWGLDEGSGTTTADSSGNGNTGTLAGTPLPTWTAGRVGNALSFAGSGGFVNFPNSPSLNNLQSQSGGGMSFVAWIYPTSSNAPQAFLDKGAWQFGFYADLGIQFGHFCTSGLVGAYSPANSVPLNQWSQIVATWNGSTAGSGILIYVNGAAVTTNSQSCSGSASDDSANALTLGGTYYNGDPFFGKLDDIGVYNRVLSASEVSTLYTTNTGGLAGAWALDEGSGTTTADSSGNGNTGNLSGTPLPTWTTGLVGNALSFAGSGGFVNFPNLPSLSNLQSQGGGGMSVVTWIYPTSSNTAQAFLDKGAWQFGFYAGLGIQFGHFCTSGLVGAYSPANSVPLNQWSQIVATWSGSITGSSILMYINGALVTTNSQSCSGSASDDSANALTLGGTYYNGDPFFGKLDDILVYNRVLSASEVSTLYQKE